MALGAFLAGMMLGESQYRHQLEADIRPFRDILMGLFFITVGMRLELHVLLEQFHWAIIGTILMMTVKVLLIRASAWLFKADKQDSWAAGFKLCQMGEFSFVIAAMAVNHTVLSSEEASLLLTIGIFSMALTPLMVNKSLIMAKRMVEQPSPDVEPSSTESSDEHDYHDHVLIFGFGRVGQSVSRLLAIEAIPFCCSRCRPRSCSGKSQRRAACVFR